MNNIDPYVVRISIAGTDLGSAMLIFPLNEPEQAYIVTALHVLEADNGSLTIDKTTITVHFYQNSGTYLLTDTDRLLIGENTATEDFGLMVIPRSQVPVMIDPREAPELSTLAGKEIAAQTNGYPKATGNRDQLSLYQCHLLGDQDYPDEVQLETTDPVTQQHDAGDLVEGYSGSPVFLEVRGKIGVFALFLEYDELTRRIKAIRITFLNILLARNKLPELLIRPMETDTAILDDLERLRANTDRVVNRIQNQIGGIQIDRTILKKQLAESLKAHKLTILYGRPGMGKSALAKELLTGNKEFELIALQGEQLDRASLAAVFTIQPMEINTGLETLLSSPAIPGQKLILVDSIEKLLETTNSDTVIDFFTLLRERDDLKLVLTTRTYALDHIKLRFLQQFSTYGDLEITALTDPELDQVTAVYPFLKPLLQNASPKKILEIPFNIDKATRISSEAFQAVTTERAFKSLMWEQVIQNAGKEPALQRQQLRGDVFTEVAIARAKAATPYIHLPNLEPQIQAALITDEILELDPARPGFVAPSHDIYEDWALVRMIEYAFRQTITTATIKDFYEHIGTAPAIRRAFRLWVSEELHLKDYNIADLISRSLTDPDISTHWKDEILIAIMQSPYSEKFLTDHKDLLLAGDRQLFIRCSLLLRVACQTPDFRLVSLLDADEKNYIYHNAYLRPYGEGWPNLIEFIAVNLDTLATSYEHIIPVIRQWQKKLLLASELPREFRSAALIQFHYFEYLLAHYDDEDFTAPKESDDKKGIELLYKAAPLIPDEIKKLLTLILHSTENESYKISGLLRELRKMALTFENSLQLAKLYPDQIIALAKKSWFYYPPTEEELQARYGSQRFLYASRQANTEEQFGIKESHGDRYSPPCAYRTPIWHLLKNHPKKAVDFINELFNHSSNSLFQSDYLQGGTSMWPDDERRELALKLPDGQTVVQKSSRSLWCQYRGKYIATPYLLTSVLMALEKWLTGIAAIAQATNKPATETAAAKFFLMDQATYLLGNSRSIAVTAVIVSTAKAYPDLLGELILPVLEFKELYHWDLNRQGGERERRYGSIEDQQWIKAEAKRTDEAPQHQIGLTRFVQLLSSSALKSKIEALLDRLKAIAAPSETDWRLMLNYMDLRGAKVLAETENAKLLMPKIDEDLVPVVRQAQEEQGAIQPVRQSGNWTLTKWQGEPVENDTYEEWQKHYQVVSKINTLDSTTRLFAYPGIIASIGTRDFYKKLNPEEREWCIEKLFYIIDAELKGSHHYFQEHGDKNYSAFDPEPVLEALVDLIPKVDAELLLRTKEYIFASLVFVNNSLQRESLIKKFKEELWKSDPDFAMACISGLVSYAPLAPLYQRILHQQPAYYYRINKRQATKWGRLLQNWKEKLLVLFIGKTRYQAKIEQKAQKVRTEWIEDFNTQVNAIISDVLNGNKTLVIPAIDHRSTLNSLIEAFELLPLDGYETETAPFLDFMITFMAGQVHRETSIGEEKIPYETRQAFTKQFSAHLLYQPEESALTIFRKLWEAVFTSTSKPIYYNDARVELLKECLKEMLWQVDTSKQFPASFWAIWKYVLKQVQATPTHAFNELLLFNSGLKLNQEWQGLEGHQALIKELITELKDVEETARLISGIGFPYLMPEALEWYSMLIKDKDLNDEKAVYLSEKLIINTYYNRSLRHIIKNNFVLRSSLAEILDQLIDASSATAFVVRDDLMSIN